MPIVLKRVIDRLCRTRHMPPGALAVNTSRLNAPPPPPHTTATAPPPHTTATPSLPLTAQTPPLPQKIKAASQSQTTDTSPTFEESTFVPIPGVTHHVLQGPIVNHTTIAGEEVERDQTVSDEEEEAVEQAFASGQGQ
ncbi:unnamed protein product [Vicia faba]|uniref:Uncharacterized protein n=1 Tax=Vicia faba TaxID=3906 RepID=A0AAV1AFV6_VICFA|nr:unnamed protein product [Vicia faba]